MKKLVCTILALMALVSVPTAVASVHDYKKASPGSVHDY
jgi:hypothetical protein